MPTEFLPDGSVCPLERACGEELRQGLALPEDRDDRLGPTDDLQGPAKVPIGLDLVGDLVIFRFPVILEFPLDESLVRSPGDDPLAEPNPRDSGFNEAQLVRPEEKAKLAVPPIRFPRSLLRM